VLHLGCSYYSLCFMRTLAGWCEGPPLVRKLKPNLSGFGFLYCFTNFGKDKLNGCRTMSWLFCPTAMLTVETTASLALCVNILVSIRIHKLVEKASKHWRNNFVFQTGNRLIALLSRADPLWGAPTDALVNVTTYPVARNLRQYGAVSHLPHYFMTRQLIK